MFKPIVLALLLFSLAISQTTAAATTTKCPVLVNCLIEPCRAAILSGGCPNYPNAVCVSSYCGSCKADWYYNGKIVTCGAATTKTTKKTTTTKCVTYNCFIDPCQSAILSGGCKKYPKAECKSNYCNGCNAVWYYNNQIVNCQ